MIESKILGPAVGIQRQDTIDNSETAGLPSLANGVIVGRFKRGRMDKVFKVTASNYKALLGHDPSNPSYLAVEDAFKRGISQIGVRRIGGSGGGGSFDFSALPINQGVSIYNFGTVDASSNYFYAHASIEVNGVLYNSEKNNVLGAIFADPYLSSLFDAYESSSGYFVIYLKAQNVGTVFNIIIDPEAGALERSRLEGLQIGFRNGDAEGLVLPDDTFVFRLQVPPV